MAERSGTGAGEANAMMVGRRMATMNMGGGAGREQQRRGTGRGDAKLVKLDAGIVVEVEETVGGVVVMTPGMGSTTDNPGTGTSVG